jgi:tetratricopeptide (TPR) repeat protein
VQPEPEKTKLFVMSTSRGFKRLLRVGMGLGCFLMFCVADGFSAGAQSSDAARLDKNFREAHHRFLTETNDPEAAWQFSRACFDLADSAANSTSRAEFAGQGIAAGQRALEEDNNSAPAHYYLGMNIGQLADTKHNFSGLRMVKDMEREFLAAGALDERFDYGGPDRNLGLLYEQAPVVISIGSRSKSREHLEKAVELAPDFPENRLNLIEAYLKWDYHAEALRELQNLEKIWPEAQKKLTGEQWASSWEDWTKRLNNARRKLDDNSKITGSPHSSQ